MKLMQRYFFLPCSSRRILFAVEKAIIISPLVDAAKEPVLPTPSAALFDNLESWFDKSGASVAITTMIEP